MTVYELPRYLMNELKGMYLCETQESVSWGELIAADKIPDEVVFDYYEGFDFSPDDFATLDVSFNLDGMSVNEVIEILSALPKEFREWEFSCCGYNNFWVNVRGNEEEITVDTDKLS